MKTRQALRPLLPDSRANGRAAQAMRCLPFRRAFYEWVADHPLSSKDFCQHTEASRFCRRSLNSSRVEDHWIWLIRLGVLRREVDGQGLTERVRLTPMGRDVLQLWPGEIPRGKPPERLQHFLRRHRPRL